MANRILYDQQSGHGVLLVHVTGSHMTTKKQAVRIMHKTSERIQQAWSNCLLDPLSAALTALGVEGDYYRRMAATFMQMIDFSFLGDGTQIPLEQPAQQRGL